MNISLPKTIFINIIFPVVTGCLIYQYKYFADYIINYLPDALWSYALCYCLLLIWDNQMNYFWAIILFSLFVLFELFQYLHIINGTGDILDILTYLISSIVAFLTNKYIFITIIKYSKHDYPI